MSAFAGSNESHKGAIIILAYKSNKENYTSFHCGSPSFLPSKPPIFGFSLSKFKVKDFCLLFSSPSSRLSTIPSNNLTLNSL